MANRAKNKGDEGERQAVAALLEHVADLAVPLAMRKLGAGRREDTGDLWVLPDVAIQVKTYRDPVKALRAAVNDAVLQASNGMLPLHLAMVIIPHSKNVRWLMASQEWPIDVKPLFITGTPMKAIDWIRDETQTRKKVWGGDAPPRTERIAIINRKDQPDIWVGPIEAWTRAYRARLADTELSHGLSDEFFSGTDSGSNTDTHTHTDTAGASA